MTSIRRAIAGAALLLSISSLRGQAQVTFSSACTPGIPSCGSLRFFVSAVGGISIDELFIQLLSPSWQFVSGGSPGVGSYSATDSYGPFSGFTAIGALGTSLGIDFFGDNGFSFELLGSDKGYIDVESTRGLDPGSLYFSASGVTSSGDKFNATVTPEPAAVYLLATGLAVLGLIARRRRRDSTL